MNIRTLSAIVLLPISAIATSCDETAESTAVITIETSDWNGWDPDHESTVTTETHTVREGESFEFSRAFFLDGLSAEVESIDDDSVTVTLNEPLSPAGGGGIDMQGMITTVTMTEGDVMELATPSTDAGLFYDVTVKISS